MSSKYKIKVRNVETPSGVVKLRYRKGTTDENVIEEVLGRKAYRRVRLGFDVEEGETWLDLGGNIGTFTAYCLSRGASEVDTYEPDEDCFELLKKSLGSTSSCNLYRGTATHYEEEFVNITRSPRKDAFVRQSVERGYKTPAIEVPNFYVGDINKEFDGVKMDIEGSELGIIDNQLIPRCNKLCMEYHTSVDNSKERMRKRISYLKTLFEVVHYAPHLDRWMASPGRDTPRYDSFIYCLNAK